MKKPKPTQAGIDKGTALLLVFVGLKLGDQLDWSWWWTFSPSWATAILLMVLSLRLLSSPSHVLLERKYRPGQSRVSAVLGFNDSLFLMLFILKWTGYLSWSWFWITSPLWLLKSLGFLVMSRRPWKARKRRRYKTVVRSLVGSFSLFVSIALVALRLDGHLSSWWWVAAGSLFAVNLAVVFGTRLEASLSRRFRREKAGLGPCRS